jgi:hypothetical protein
MYEKSYKTKSIELNERSLYEKSFKSKVLSGRGESNVRKIVQNQTHLELNEKSLNETIVQKLANSCNGEQLWIR